MVPGPGKVVCTGATQQDLHTQFLAAVYYEHRAPCDTTQIGRFHRELGEERLERLLKASIDAAVAMQAVKPKIWSAWL